MATEGSGYTTDQQIECVRREIGMRQRVYPNWVAAKKMSQAKADYEIACLKEVLTTLENLKYMVEAFTK